MQVNENLKILIVEDELLLSHTMQEMIQEIGYTEISIANSYEEALHFLSTIHVELAILDINLGKGKGGLDLAKKCLLENIPFFYVSSYTDRKTLDLALETAPGAYVIKPVIPTNLYSAIQLSTQNSKKEHYFHFKDSNRNIKITSAEILYLEADGIYLHIVTASKNYLSRMTLASALELLPGNEFSQIHRSFVVNHLQISEATSNSLLVRNKKLPISRTFKEEFKKVYLNQ